MTKRIDAELKYVHEIFSSSPGTVLGKDGVFTIPEFQRAYNWINNEQCDKLWQDIDAFICRESSDAYFFGSIIISEGEDGQLDVIDGQQRITTFLLLLKALLLRISQARKGITSPDEDTDKLKDALEARERKILGCLFLIDEDSVSAVMREDKSLTELDIKYFNESINEEYPEEVKHILQGKTFSEIENNVVRIKHKKNDNKHTNFFRNFKFFYVKSGDYDLAQINKFAKTLLDKCQVIVVRSYYVEEAIEIFNSLNSTGMPLASADILAAKLYNNYGSEDKSSFSDSWRQVVVDTNALNAQKIVSIDDILNQYMYILRAERKEKDTTIPGVRRYFTEINRNSLLEPRKFITDLETIIDFWQIDGCSGELFNLRQILLKHNGNFKFYYATYLFFNKEESEDKKVEFVRALLKLFAILKIAGKTYSSAEFKVFLIELNAKIGTGANTDELVDEIEAHIHSRFGREEIESALLNESADKATVYLNEYLFSKEENISIDLDIPKIEIEHIMPTSGRKYPSIREDANMTLEDFEHYVNKLGNMILLEQNINRVISNDWFMTKRQKSIADKRGYKDSIFPIAQALVGYPSNQWGKADIDKATEKGARRIVDFIFSKAENL